jgi:O-antigen/teichoic acid export membrane protein
MTPQVADNRRIANNAVWLTIRTVVMIAVRLYTSRVVLEALGIVDFGVYGVVGGLTAMLSFMNTSMSGATSRFLTFEMGRGNNDALRRTFSSAMVCHLLIALALIVIAETAGVWFLNAKLNIPPDRLTAANWVLQFAILSASATIIQVPFNALVIAHERMNVYAYIELLNAFMQLGVVYLLGLFAFDKLIVYSSSLFGVALIVSITYAIYCRYHFTESRFGLIWDKSILTPMVKFCLLDLYGNMSVMALMQGRNFLINIFFGVVCNAAVTVATSVQAGVSQLTSAISQAFRPQIIKQYAAGNLQTMAEIMLNALTFSSIAVALLMVPLLVKTEYVINLWLGEIPPNSPEILRCLLINTIFNNFGYAPTLAIHATGNIKRLSFISGTLYLLNPLCVWAAFKMGAPVWSAYVLGIALTVMCIALTCYYVTIQIPTLSLRPLLRQAARLSVLIIAAIAVMFTLSAKVSLFGAATFPALLAVIAASTVIITVPTWFGILTPSARAAISSRIFHRNNQI